MPIPFASKLVTTVTFIFDFDEDKKDGFGFGQEIKCKTI
jgi:hypothetical protein